MASELTSSTAETIIACFGKYNGIVSILHQQILLALQQYGDLDKKSDEDQRRYDYTGGV